ncbi:MAG: accessory gene regulator B family protein [Clostridium sp.]
MKWLKVFNSNDLSKIALRYIEPYIEKDTICLDRVRVGFEVIFINISKLMILFIIALFMNTLLESFVVLISFGVLRRTAGGIHAKTSTRCTIYSVLSIEVAVLLSRNVDIGTITFILLILILNILVFKFAPKDTELNPIKSSRDRENLKVLSLRNLNLIIFISVLFKSEIIVNLVFAGLILAVLSILPITFRIFK